MAFTIIPVIEAGVCLSLGFDGKYEKEMDDCSLYIDVYGKFEVSIALDLGAYFPSSINPIRVSLNLGIKGIIGSGKAGIQLKFYLKHNKYSIDLYYVFKAIQFNFYLMLKFSIKYDPFINFDFNVEIVNYLIFGLKYEYHKIKNYNYNSTYIGSKKKETKKNFRFFKVLTKY